MQSRTALWDEVRRLAADGVTVFLTTQYLEEADVLAHRVGHHRPRQDRGRGHAGGAEGGDRATERRSGPGRPGRPRAPRRGSARASARRRRPRPTRVAAQLPEGVSDLAEIVRTLDAEGIAIADLRLHAPTLDDVFLAKTGRSLEGAGDGAATRRSRRAPQPVAS